MKLEASRIPRIILMTVASVNESLTNYGRLMSAWWTRNPEYAYMLLSDADCEAFLAACCPRNERIAYSLIKHGAARADLFRAIFMREVGGVYVDQDSAVKRPLHDVIPTSAPAVTHIAQNKVNTSSAAWNFNFLAFEPGSPIWQVQVRRVVASVFEQAAYSCHRDKRGCKGFYACVQNITGSRPYRLSVQETTQKHGCAGMHDCKASTHDKLRGLVVLGDDELPLVHQVCHAKQGQKHPCVRPKESKAHYVSIPAAAINYYRTPDGKRDGSSAPAYFKPWCSNAAKDAAKVATAATAGGGGEQLQQRLKRAEQRAADAEARAAAAEERLQAMEQRALKAEEALQQA